MEIEYKSFLECFWFYMQSIVYSFGCARCGMYAWPLSGYCDTRYSQPGYLIDLIEMKKDPTARYGFFIFMDIFFLLSICEWFYGSDCELHRPQRQVCPIGHINQDESIHSSPDVLVHQLRRYSQPDAIVCECTQSEGEETVLGNTRSKLGHANGKNGSFGNFSS